MIGYRAELLPDVCAERVWTIGELLDAALATQPIDPIVTAPDRRKRFTVIEGGKA